MLQREGQIEDQMMYNTYNMGLGMILAVAKEDVEETMNQIRSAGETSYVDGEILDGAKGVTLC